MTEEIIKIRLRERSPVLYCPRNFITGNSEDIGFIIFCEDPELRKRIQDMVDKEDNERIMQWDKNV